MSPDLPPGCLRAAQAATTGLLALLVMLGFVAMPPTAPVGAPGTARAESLALEPGPAATTAPATAPPGSTAPTGTPTPGITTGTNPANPFTESIGGAALGQTGSVVVDPKAPVRPPNVDVASYVVADLDTGEILAAKNAHAQLPPASTLKTLTAIALLPRLDKRARYTAVQADANMEGSKVGVEAGSIYTIDQLFYGLFLPSGNDAANALANASGGMRAAVRLMNAEAKRLGAFDTHAVNSSGLDEPKQVSSAYDLALFAREGMGRADFRKYATTPRYNFPGRGGKTFQIQNGNKLLANYPGAIGVKNGYTTQAHNTFVGAAERGGRRLVVSLMRTDRPSWEKAGKLLDWGFTVAEKAKPVGTLVTANEVALAAATHLTPQTASPGPTSAPSHSPTGATAQTQETPTAGAVPRTVRPGVTILPDTLQRLPLWIWVTGAAFVVLAGLRVYSHVRTRRRAPAARVP
ncbi:D-alanyl-D-alanine carboxypeptidase family protein [Actinopolymorpha alba]|uniref:D-alanyl-D-alanine carboxypeptidase family protein n=1 Tax=Actinopolymorpha alba TaxID=533267 RepID=UPI000A2EED00|nr:D-alanyl-D-alanine carboxypeptidase [Actinopolymorpha alba]